MIDVKVSPHVDAPFYLRRMARDDLCWLPIWDSTPIHIPFTKPTISFSRYDLIYKTSEPLDYLIKTLKGRRYSFLFTDLSGRGPAYTFGAFFVESLQEAGFFVISGGPPIGFIDWQVLRALRKKEIDFIKKLREIEKPKISIEEVVVGEDNTL